MKNNYCRVCGLYIDELPWGEDSNSPIYEICPCCGVEFGNEDYTVESAKQFREIWIKGGMAWFEPGKKPANWKKEEQFKNIPEEFI